MPNPPIRLMDLPDKAVLIIQCGECGHRATVLPIRLLSLKVPVELPTPLREIAARTRCRCGHRSHRNSVTYSVVR